MDGGKRIDGCLPVRLKDICILMVVEWYWMMIECIRIR